MSMEQKFIEIMKLYESGELLDEYSLTISDNLLACRDLYEEKRTIDDYYHQEINDLWNKLQKAKASNRNKKAN